MIRASDLDAGGHGELVAGPRRRAAHTEGLRVVAEVVRTETLVSAVTVIPAAIQNNVSSARSST